MHWMQCPSWKDLLDPQERKSLRNKFGSINRAVRMVLMHAESYPSVPDDPSRYKEVVHKISVATEERIREIFGLKDKSISIYKLDKIVKLPPMKELVTRTVLLYETSFIRSNPSVPFDSSVRYSSRHSGE